MAVPKPASSIAAFDIDDDSTEATPAENMAESLSLQVSALCSWVVLHGLFDIRNRLFFPKLLKSEKVALAGKCLSANSWNALC